MGLKFFDLFAGIGGFRLGMERAGHECIGSCEWDKHARETYKTNIGSYPLSFLKLLGLQKKKDHLIYSLRTSEAYSLTTKEERLTQSSPRLMKWGMMRNGKCLTANISFHKTGNVSSLSDILEENVPDKYFLSESMTKKLMQK